MILDNEHHREYYLEKDPAHLEFKASIQSIVEKVVIVDYEPSVF